MSADLQVSKDVFAHLYAQAEMSGTRARCRYREGELMCAFGALIPDELYDEEMEDRSANDLLSLYEPLRKYIHERYPGLNLVLLRDLQHYHDELWAKTKREYREKLVEGFPRAVSGILTTEEHAELIEFIKEAQ